MKALLLVDHADEQLQLTEVDRPEPKPGQALIKIKAAALNRRDQWCREGKYPNLVYNCIMGSDGSGVVESVGHAEDTSWVGKEVIINPNINWGYNPAAQSPDYRLLGMPDNGTFAEYIVVNVDRLHSKPANLDMEAAAALPLAGVTAYRAVFTQGHVKSGDNVLISGVGGGVAQFAFLFSVAAGANTYITSSNNQKLEKAIELGAKGGFNYKTVDWPKTALKQTGGFDVVIDSAGGDQINDFIRMINPAGSIVFYGATNGLPKSLDLYRLFWSQGRLQGSTMGSDEEFETMIAFIEKHKIKPVIDSIRPFDDIISGFNDLKDGKQFGKIIIKIS